MLVVPEALDGLDRLLRIAEPLAASRPPRELVVAAVVGAAELSGATAELAQWRERLRDRGVAARAAAFSSPSPGDDVVRLASQQGVDLLICDAGATPLEGAIVERAPCDVAMLVAAGASLEPGPVVVPFGAASHDWAALELGAWVARATDRPLRLIGAAGDDREDGRDASRLLADASLIVQRQAGVVAEPLLARPGRSGVMALAAGAGLLGGRPVGPVGAGRPRSGARAARRDAAGADRARAPRRRGGGHGARARADALRVVADGGGADEPDPRPGHDVRRLPHRVADRPRRHGRRLPRDRPVARASGRAEADRAGVREGRAVPAAVPQGAAARGGARPPERRPDLRGARARRPAVPGDALRARRGPQDADRPRRALPPERGGAHAGPGRRRARRRPPPRARPPRRQAGEHPARRGRPRLPRPTSGSPSAELGLDGERRRSSGRSTTWRRSGSAASRSTAAATSTRSPACCTSAWPARRRSGARPRPRRCGRTSRATSRRCPATPTLDPVLAKGLAKDASERYATCTELVDAARAIVAPPAIPGVRSPRVRRALLRRRRPILRRRPAAGRGRGRRRRSSRSATRRPRPRSARSATASRRSTRRSARWRR